MLGLGLARVGLGLEFGLGFMLGLGMVKVGLGWVRIRVCVGFGVG